MKTRTRTLFLTILVVLVLTVAGCTGGGPGGDASGDRGGDVPEDGAGDAPGATTIQQEATAAMQDAETGAYSLEMTERVGNRTETVLRVDGAFDVPNRKLRTTVENPDMANHTLTQYVVDGTTYTGMGGEWFRAPTGDQVDWDGQPDRFDTQQAVLANADVEVTGTDEVDGREVWVLTVDSTLDSLESPGGQPGSGDLLGAVDLSNAEITQYVDTETSHVLQTVARINATRSGQRTSITMTTSLSNVDEPVTIELPAEAEDATEVPSGFGENGAAGGAFGS